MSPWARGSALQEGSGAAGGPRGVHTHLRAAAERGTRGDEVELPEVEVMRRDLEKDVVGRRIKTGRGQGLEERDARDPPAQDPQGLHVPARRAQDHQDRTPRQVPAAHAGLRGGAGRPFRHERAVPARDGAGGDAAAHPRGADVPAGRRPPLHRPSDVRRDCSWVLPTTWARSRSCSTWRSTRSTRCSRGRRSSTCWPSAPPR